MITNTPNRTQPQAAPPFIDIQSQTDARNVFIQKVGIRDLKYPIHVLTQSGQRQPTVATFEMSVGLQADVRGTHMSRFIEILHAQDWLISWEGLAEMLGILQTRLQAEHAFLKIHFPFFIEKRAPVSGAQSLMDYQVTLCGERHGEQPPHLSLQVQVPVTSLCPCSKAISQYGAHNQRSLLTLTIQSKTPVTFEYCIHLLEQQGSCELFALLKRPDEKWTTEQAYKNPKFVEDIVRDIAVQLNQDPSVVHYHIQAENLESIHHHAAFAEVLGAKCKLQL